MSCGAGARMRAAAASTPSCAARPTRGAVSCIQLFSSSLGPRERLHPKKRHKGVDFQLGLAVALPEMTPQRSPSREWRSDVLLLAALNGAGYLWSFWSSGWQVPHFGGYICWIGAVISLVPAPREIRNARFRTAALVGLALSCLVLWHIFTTPCTGPCK